MATTSVTIPFEAKDLISGSIRKISSQLRDATDELISFRRASGDMASDFISSSRRAKDSANDLGRYISSARDEARGLGRERVDDIFSRARKGADDLRSAVGRAQSEINSLSDAHVQLRARDEVSPALDGIHSKITAITAAAGSLVIGGGIKDSIFGDVTEYGHEAARSAPYLSVIDRQSSLLKADDLYKKGFFGTRSEAAGQVADIAPLVHDKRQVPDFIEASAKMKYIRPDSSWEEMNRALGQSTNVFKETPQQVADSMMYAYSKVGDRQQDLFDTFWEYSGYFKKTDATSSQMSNFLTKSVQAGSFNFDKPADFIKETFGVKALDSGDMEKYFVSRGSSKDVAKNQAEHFTSDINSGDAQRARGALMALVGDLSSQKPDELKASLVQLGSATAEDNGDAILKTWKTIFEKPPSDIVGTTDRMIKTQKDADPMQELVTARREMDLLLQGIGQSIATDTLPVIREFNSLLVSNKEEIQNIFGRITSGITTATEFYKNHFATINNILIGIAGIIATKKILGFGTRAFDFGKGAIETVGERAKRTKELYVGARDRVSDSFVGRGYRKTKDWAAETYVGQQTRRFGTWARASPMGRGYDRARSLFSRKQEVEEERKNFTLAGRKREQDSGYGMHSLSSMTVQAARVYINGSLSGSDGGRRGRNARNDLGRRGGYDADDIAPRRRTRSISRDRAQDIIGRHGPEPEPEKKGLWGRTKNAIFNRKPRVPESGVEEVGKLAKLGKFAKGAGIVGALTGAGMGAYELYQASRKDGLREAISTRGGAVAGGVIGGAALGAAGSIFGPAGTMVGAAAGNWLGTKAGEFFDSKGWTKSLVDSFVSTKDKLKDWWSGGSKETKKADDDLKHVAGTTKQQTDQTKQHLVGLGTQSGQTADKTKSNLEAVGGIAGQGQVWGTTLMSGLLGSISSQIPYLQSSVSQIRSIFSGVSTPSFRSNSTAVSNPFSDITPYADGGIINRPHMGLVGEAGPEVIIPLAGSRRKRGFELWEQTGRALGVRMYADGGFTHRSFVSDSIFGNRASLDFIPRSQSAAAGGHIPIAQTLSKSPRSVSVGAITIQMDFGEMAKQVKDFPAFAKMLTSPEGEYLLEKQMGKILHRALENGG